MDRHTLDRTRKRMGAILDTVDYDFSRFTMEGFRKYLEACTGYSIQFVPWAMRSAVSGSWIVSSDGRGFIFFDAEEPQSTDTRPPVFVRCTGGNACTEPDWLPGTKGSTAQADRKSAGT